MPRAVDEQRVAVAQQDATTRRLVGSDSPTGSLMALVQYIVSILLPAEEPSWRTERQRELATVVRMRRAGIGARRVEAQEALQRNDMIVACRAAVLGCDVLQHLEEGLEECKVRARSRQLEWRGGLAAPLQWTD